MKRNKYGKSSEKALSFEELDYLKFNLQELRDRILLIGSAYAGLRIGELVQCRLEWLRWDMLTNADGKQMRVLAIDIPKESRNILNLYEIWRPKTKTERTTYILDEVLAQTFILFYQEHPKGIGELFKSKKTKSLIKNLSSYVIAVRFKKMLQQYHIENFKTISNGKLSQDELKTKAQEIRSKLSAHPLRSTYENLLFYKYKVPLDICASLLGHSEEIARKHYVSKSTGNIKHKLGEHVIKNG